MADNRNLHAELMEGLAQMKLHREGKIKLKTTVLGKDDIKAIRNKTKLSQARFAALIGVEVTTLRNWEQGRREPTGPAKSLLKVVDRNPKAVIEALAG